MAKRKNSDEIAAVCALLPKHPPHEAIEKAKQRDFGDLLVYKAEYVQEPDCSTKTKLVRVRCTACGEEFYAEHVSIKKYSCSRGYAFRSDDYGFLHPETAGLLCSYDLCECPMCGGHVKVMHHSRCRYTYKIGETTFATVHVLRGHLFAFLWAMQKLCDQDGYVTYPVFAVECLGLIDGSAVRFKCSYGDWSALATVDKNCYDFEKSDVLYFDKEAFCASAYAKSALDILIENGGTRMLLFQYLQLWNRFPKIENFVRSGYAKFVCGLIRAECGRGSSWANMHFCISGVLKLFDRKKARPHEMLGMEKEDLHLLNELSTDHFLLWHFGWRKEKIRLTEERLLCLNRWGCHDVLEFFENAKALGADVPIMRFTNYLTGQKTKAVGLNVSPSYLYDYWSMLQNVYGGISIALMWPKDLTEAHDRLVKLQKDKANAILSEKIAAGCEKLALYSFTDAELGLTIFPCPDHASLIEEGKRLDHCVARYADSVANGKTSIYFIRKIGEEEKPFYTLEYRNGHIVQDHGYKNKLQTGEILEFEKKWLCHMKEVDKNGKHNRRNQSEIRAGA